MSLYQVVCQSRPDLLGSLVQLRGRAAWRFRGALEGRGLADVAVKFADGHLAVRLYDSRAAKSTNCITSVC